MADSNTAPVAGAPTIPSVRVLDDVPVIFSDGVLSHSFAFGISKFFLYRTDNDPGLTAPPKEVVTAQIIMPTENFIRMVAFFEHRLKLMVASSEISQAKIDAARQFWVDNPTAGQK
jgi:hypothetical protein